MEGGNELSYSVYSVIQWILDGVVWSFVVESAKNVNEFYKSVLLMVVVLVKAHNKPRTNSVANAHIHTTPQHEQEKKHFPNRHGGTGPHTL